MVGEPLVVHGEFEENPCVAGARLGRGGRPVGELLESRPKRNGVCLGRGERCFGDGPRERRTGPENRAGGGAGARRALGEFLKNAVKVRQRGRRPAREARRREDSGRELVAARTPAGRERRGERPADEPGRVRPAFLAPDIPAPSQDLDQEGALGGGAFGQREAGEDLAGEGGTWRAREAPGPFLDLPWNERAFLLTRFGPPDALENPIEAASIGRCGLLLRGADLSQPLLLLILADRRPGGGRLGEDPRERPVADILGPILELAGEPGELLPPLGGRIGVRLNSPREREGGREVGLEVLLRCRRVEGGARASFPPGGEPCFSAASTREP